jgi:PAS domain S-box-containing protein
MLDGIPAGVLVLDPARRILYANDWWSEHTGLTADQLADSTLYDLLPETEHAQADRALGRLSDTLEATSWEARLEGLAGEMVVTFSARPVCIDGGVTCAQVSCLDVTAHRRALDEAERYQRDLARLRLESAVLYGIGVGCTLAMDVGEVLRLIYVHASQLYRFSSFAILLYDAGTGEVGIELQVHDGQSSSPRRWSLVESQDPVAYALLSAQPLLIDDWSQEASRPATGGEYLVEPNARSWLSVPLGSQDRVLGMIYLQHTEPGAFSEADQRSLYAIADQATLFIENAQLHETQRKRVLQLEVVRDLGQRIASYLELNELLTNSAELLRERFGYDRVRIYLNDHERDRLTPGAQSPSDPRCPARPIALDQQDQDPLVWVAMHGRSRLSRDRLPSAASGTGSSELCVPIRFADRILGVLDVYQAGNGFDERDLFILESLSSQIAAGIENAQLYEVVNKQLAEVSTLYMLSDQLSSSLDTNTVLDLVTDILKRVLNCRGCVIFLLDEDKEWLEIQVSSGIKPQWRQTRLRLGEGIAGRVAQTGQPVYIPDTRQDPDFIVFDPAVRSLLVVPLMHKGQTVGTLNVDDDKPDAFPPDTVRILSIAGAQAAVAIENARLFEALRERAERLARAHRELQESDRLRTEFVQNISHELRTPLTFIRGYVELLLDGALGQLTQQQVESLQIVAERTARVTQLVDDILALQQVERGDLHLVPVSLEQIAHAEVRSARAMAEQEGLSLVEDYAPDLRPALGDPERLGRVFANLIGNAIKFTPGSSTITVRLSNEEDLIRVEVIDEGIGIAEDHLERIFERFYQVDGSSKRRFRGTGLGLAIVKEIIDAQGGTINVSSEVGTGSTFSFTVPVATSPPADPA